MRNAGTCLWTLSILQAASARLEACCIPVRPQDDVSECRTQNALNVCRSGRVRSGRCRAEPGAAPPRGGEINGRRAPRFRRSPQAENGRTGRGERPRRGKGSAACPRAEQVAGWEAGAEQLRGRFASLKIRRHLQKKEWSEFGGLKNAMRKSKRIAWLTM